PASFAVRSLQVGLVTIGVYLVAGLLFLPSVRQPLIRTAIVGIGTVSVIYSTWLLGGQQVEIALVAGMRIVVLALPGAVLSIYVDPAALADQLGQRLRLPARFVVGFAAALQRFERLG